MALPAASASASSSARILYHPSNRHISKYLHLKNPSPFKFQFQFQFQFRLLSPRSSGSHFINRPPSFKPFPIFKSPPHLSIPSNHIHRILFGPKDNSFRWNFASGRHDGNSLLLSKDEEGPEVAVVLLGWLGAKPKHLRRYVELYNSRGIHALTFVVSVMDVLSFDLGKKLEESIGRLTLELESWLSGRSDDDGRERYLIFHTFSNTGWMAYGAILDNLKDRQDLLGRVKGCVVDSGGDPNIDPKVWAAGFTTALLKKSSSAIYPSVDAGQESKIEEKEPFLIETLFLVAFEKLFSYLLNLPNVNQRLAKIISTLSVNQPSCPQLYLYSSGDKVIPYQAVESFIEEQRRIGIRVLSFNFGSSPHVDHYRTFPHIYVSQLHDFLKECLAMVGKL